MKKFFLVILCVISALTLSAQTPDGLTCETAIPVNSSYIGSIPAPGTYYFTAWTYDLPLTCYFYPEDENVTELYLDIDFSCTPGVYEDPNIQELVDETMGWGIKMPMRFDRFVQGVDPVTNKKYYSYVFVHFEYDYMPHCVVFNNEENKFEIVSNLSKKSNGIRQIGYLNESEEGFDSRTDIPINEETKAVVYVFLSR